MFKATEDICLTQDRQRAVPATNPDAFSLLVPAGGELTDEVAARYGLSNISTATHSGALPVTPGAIDSITDDANPAAEQVQRAARNVRPLNRSGKTRG